MAPTPPSHRVLASGSRIPAIGAGTFGSDRYDAETVGLAVEHSLRAGFRLLDCATVYGNEPRVGRAIADSGVDRDALFVMSKIWNDAHESAAAALSDPPVRVTMNLAAWEEALGAYWDEYESMDDGPAARSPQLLIVDRSKPREWTVRQIINDPDGNHDWAIVATVDLDACAAAIQAGSRRAGHS